MPRLFHVPAEILPRLYQPDDLLMGIVTDAGNWSFPPNLKLGRTRRPMDHDRRRKVIERKWRVMHPETRVTA